MEKKIHVWGLEGLISSKCLYYPEQFNAQNDTNLNIKDILLRAKKKMTLKFTYKCS